MASVLHRTTLQFIESANSPDYPVEDWIHNPVMTAVSGIPARCWVVDGDLVRAMTDAENDAANLTYEKAAKITSVDARTNELISTGFVYNSKTFSLSITAQSKMMGTHQIKDDPALVYPISWNSIDDLDTHSIADEPDLDAFYLTALGTIRGYLDSGTALKDSVRTAVTVAAVAAVSDTR